MEMSLAAVIREARHASGKTQKDLADLLGVSQATVSQWESGINQPTLTNRIDLAAVLTIPFHKLLPEARKSTLVDDPEALAIVHSFERLTDKSRQSALILVRALLEAEQSGQIERSAKK